MFEEFSNSNIESVERLEFKPRTKGKTVYFRDFIRGIVDEADSSDLDIIDAEIVQKSIPINRKE